MAVGAEMSGVLSKIHIIPHVITIQIKKSKKDKRKKETKNYGSPFSPNLLLLSLFVSK